MPCTHCGAPLPAEARFCNHCGQTPGPQNAPNKPKGTMRVCGMCGIIAPLGRTQCVACNASIANAPTVEARNDEYYWCCVLECDFACRACGMRSPLDALDLDGTVECRRCGLQQAFDVDQWKDVLIFAQDVADCAGPPGRLGKEPIAENPYFEIGIKHTFAEKTLSGMVIDGEGMKPRNLRLKATPGVPLCERCHVPLEVEVDETEYKTRATCPRCHDRALYDTPEGAFDRNADIAAILADDHRCDREAVRVNASPGGAAVAVSCPKCNASLPVTDGATMVNCAYCSTPCRIPSRLMAKFSNAAPVPKRWWILFDDDSYQRLGVDPDAEDDDDDHDHDHDHDDDGDDRMARVRAAQAAEAASRVQHSAAKPSNGPVAIGAALGVLALILVGGLVFSLVHGRANAPTTESKEPEEKATKKAAKKADDDGEKPAKVEAPLVRSKFQDLQGCSCKSGKDTRQLAVRTDVSGVEMIVGEDDGMTPKFDLSWLADTGGKYFLTHDSGAGAPPRSVKGRALAVGVACSGDVFVVVAKGHATGWSMKDQKMLWDTELGGDYSLVATPSKSSLAIQCGTVPVTGTTMRVPLVKGKTMAINVTNGAAAK